jgi:DNA topoisomerase VI subunit B
MPLRRCTLPPKGRLAWPRAGRGAASLGPAGRREGRRAAVSVSRDDPMTHTLHRTTFATSRLLEYFSAKELSTQLGAGPPRWGIILLKELVDNALDACETAGTAPHIRITLSPDGFVVEDDGPGLPASTVARSLDYRVRVSDKTYYISPTRGQLGNALKCLWAAPYVVNPESPGVVQVTSQGRRQTVAVRLDPIGQEPKMAYTVEETFVKSGTTIEVDAPKLACYSPWGSVDDFYTSGRTLVSTYAVFNPHATLTLQLPGETLVHPATTPGWAKWRPSDPTSPHWYAPEHCHALIAAYLTRERAGDRALTVREFVKQFRGLHGSAKQKLVTETAGLSRAYLHDLVDGDALDAEAIGRLLGAMQAQAQRVKPQALGALGRAHLARVLDTHHHVDVDTISYKKVTAEVSGLPCVLEVAFGAYRQESWESESRVITGINWSATPTTPFEHLDTHLSTAMVQRRDPVVVVVHLAIPRPTFRDRGKQALALPEDIEDVLEASVHQVTQRWTAVKRQAYRSHRADVKAAAELRRHERAQYPSVKDAAYRLMPEAYLAASGQGRYVAHARQIMYAARRQILAMIHPDRAAKGLNAQYFTQTLVPDYMSQHPDETADWDVVFDDRGHFREPHLQNGRERIIGLGTLAVRQYIQSWTGHVHETIQQLVLPFDVETSGPSLRYHSVLFVEKEGFDELIQQAQIAERFDIAPMSTKGMSNTAARRLVDELSRLGITIYVLHDYDKSGFSILHTLRTDTRRYRFRSTPKVIDLGLTLADVQAMDLQSEPVNYRQAADPKIDLARCGATEEEQAFLITGGRQRNSSTGKY